MVTRKAALVALAHLALASAALAQRGERFRPPEGVVWDKDVEYARVGERALALDILRPAEPPEGKMPALVYIHGGGFRAGEKEGGLSHNAPFAARGYFTVTVEYRLSGEAIFPAAIEDCKAAVRWIRANAEKYGVDPDRIGAWGHSAGGHLSALLGTSGGIAELEGTGGNAEQSSRVQCVVDCFGPTDFLALVKQRPENRPGGHPEADFLGGKIEENEERARLASPATHASADDPPFLILHGTEDPVVPFEQSEILAGALKDAGADVTFVSVEGGGHGWAPNAEADARVQAFFDRHLKGAEVEISSDPIKGEPKGRRPGGRR